MVDRWIYRFPGEGDIRVQSGAAGFKVRGFFHYHPNRASLYKSTKPSEMLSLLYKPIMKGGLKSKPDEFWCLICGEVVPQGVVMSLVAQHQRWRITNGPRG